MITYSNINCQQLQVNYNKLIFKIHSITIVTVLWNVRRSSLIGWLWDDGEYSILRACRLPVMVGLVVLRQRVQVVDCYIYIDSARKSEKLGQWLAVLDKNFLGNWLGRTNVRNVLLFMGWISVWLLCYA